MPGITLRPIATVALLLLILFAGSATAATTADAYIVIDANSGRVLTARNPDQQLYPASMTKIMTLYLTFEALSQGRLSLRTPLQVSELAAEQAPSKLGLRPGSTVTTETCIYAAVTLSANDCAMVLAENIGGSEDEFARLMTSRAHSLGMSRTHFNNPNGLPDDGQLTTAHDMSVLAQALIQRFPKYYGYFATRSFTYNGITHANHNHLMSRYPGMDGIKTGFIRASGFNLTASAVHDRHRLIAVVFGGSSAVSRDNFMAGLLDDGFRRVAGQPVAPQLITQPSDAIGPPPEKPEEPPVQSMAEADASEVDGVKLAEAGDAVEKDEGVPVAPQAVTAQPVAAPEASSNPPPEAVAQGAQAAPVPVAPAPIAPAPVKELPALSVPEDMLDAKAPPAVTPEAPPAKPVVAAADLPPEKEDQAEPAQPEHVLRVPAHAGIPAARQPESKWNVAIGTYSSRSMSDHVLLKAITTLPRDMRDDVRPVSVVLKVHHKQAYRAELTGLTQLDAKRACSVLTHCTPVRS